jgi:ribonuclease HI
LKIIDSLVVRWFFKCGEGTNTKAELVGVWASLSIAKILYIQHIQVLGDSKIVIEWLKQNGNLQAINIEGWKHIIRDLASSFQGISFQHIFKESNEEAYFLSKQALTAPRGRLTYYYWDGVMVGPTHQIQIF